MSVKNLCRLCSTGENLIWVFDKRFEDRASMRSVILLTTGIEIHTTDVISQKICDKCSKVLVKMYEFRKKALANDLRLKELWKKYQKELGKTPQENETPEPPKMQKPAPMRTPIKIHPSIKGIFKQYPSIKLPNICLDVDVAPCVTMPLDYVEEYCKARNLNFHTMSALALRSRCKNVAMKRTTPPDRSDRCRINAEIIPNGNISEASSNVVRPIKLKIISNVNLSVKDNSIVCDKPPPVVSTVNVQEDMETQGIHRKRKLSESIDTPEVAVKKPTLFVTPNESSSNLSYVANVSVPLHICNICSAVYYHAKDLKKHQSRHLRCQFCKEKFKCFEKKEEHLEGQCLIKNMNSLPDIKLEKIEFDLDVRRKYPEAFAGFPPQTDIDDTSEDLFCETDRIEIIEILSDDEEPPQENQISHTKEQPSTVVIKPDVAVKNSTIFKDIDPKANDIELLKQLLAKIEPLKLGVDKCVGTKLSMECPIKINKNAYTAQFRTLKPVLESYKIPVVIEPGNFDASFQYGTTPQPQRKMFLWNDLTPVDIKPKSVGTDPNAVSSARDCSDAVPTLISETPIIKRPELTFENGSENNSKYVLNPVGHNSQTQSSTGSIAKFDMVQNAKVLGRKQNGSTIIRNDCNAVNSIMGSVQNYTQSDTTNPVSVCPSTSMTNTSNDAGIQWANSSLEQVVASAIPSSDLLIPSPISESSQVLDLTLEKSTEVPPSSNSADSIHSTFAIKTARSTFAISQSTSTTDSVKSALQSPPLSSESNSILNGSSHTFLPKLPPPYFPKPPPPPYISPPPRYPSDPLPCYSSATHQAVCSMYGSVLQNPSETSATLRAVRSPRINKPPNIQASYGCRAKNNSTTQFNFGNNWLSHYGRSYTNPTTTMADVFRPSNFGNDWLSQYKRSYTNPTTTMADRKRWPSTTMPYSELQRLTPQKFVMPSSNGLIPSTTVSNTTSKPPYIIGITTSTTPTCSSGLQKPIDESLNSQPSEIPKKVFIPLSNVSTTTSKPPYITVITTSTTTTCSSGLQKRIDESLNSQPSEIPKKVSIPSSNVSNTTSKPPYITGMTTSTTPTCSSGLQRLNGESLINSQPSEIPKQVFIPSSTVSNTTSKPPCITGMTTSTTSACSSGLQRLNGESLINSQPSEIPKQVFIPSSTVSNNPLATPKPADVTGKATPTVSIYSSELQKLLLLSVPSMNSSDVITTSKSSDVPNKTQLDQNGNTNTTEAICQATSPQRRNSVDQTETGSTSLTHTLTNTSADIATPATTSNAVAPHVGAIRLKKMSDLI